MNDPTPDQTRALDGWEEWKLTDCLKPYTITGLAGTGKTTLLVDMSEHHKARFCAPTGKAAANLKTRGIHASTIHRLIYNFHPQRGFWLKKPREIEEDMIVVDEASMVTGPVLDDLIYLGKKLVLAGDHGQLPPVGPDPFILTTEPSASLDTIHRQAAESPIIRFAWDLRDPAYIPSKEKSEEGGDSNLRIVPVSRGMDEALKLTDLEDLTCVTARNSERRKLNNAIREQLGRSGKPFEKDDILIAKMNNYEHGIFNGQMFRVLYGSRVSRDVVVADLQPIHDPESPPFEKIPVNVPWFQPKSRPKFKEVPKAQTIMDFGYALTAHSAQGSEFDTVLAIEPKGLGHMFTNAAHRWRYTAATRAVRNLVYATPYARD